MSWLKETEKNLEEEAQRKKELEEAERQTKKANDEKWKAYFDVLERTSTDLLTRWEQLGLSQILEDLKKVWRNEKTAWPLVSVSNLDWYLYKAKKAGKWGIVNNSWGEGEYGWFKAQNESVVAAIWQARNDLYPDAHYFWEGFKPPSEMYVFGEFYWMSGSSMKGIDGGYDTIYSKVPGFALQLNQNNVSFRLGKGEWLGFSPSQPSVGSDLKVAIDQRVSQYLRQGH